MKVRVIASLVMALCVAVGSANASSIGVYFSNDGSDCDREVAQNQPFNVYILAILGGDPAAAGITGAEFRVDGFQAGWFVNRTVNPSSNVQIGTPDTGGVTMGFAGCQPGSNGIVLLYDISIFPPAATTPRTLQVDRHTNPSNVNFQCSLVTLCDSPNFTKLCVSGGAAFINRPGVSCTVGVEQSSWSKVKNLYN